MSSCSIVFMQIVLKQVTKHFLPPLALGFRGSLLFLFNLLYLMYSNTNIHTRDPVGTFSFIIVFKAIIKRSLASATTVLMYLGSVKYIPIGVANALFNTSPIMTFFIELVYYKKVYSISTPGDFSLVQSLGNPSQFYWSSLDHSAYSSIRWCRSRQLYILLHCTCLRFYCFLLHDLLA